MSISNLNHFATFLADWSLDDDSIPAFIGTIPRKEGPDNWLLGWARSLEDQAVLLIGADFRTITTQGQKAYAYLVLNQYLLGHLEADFGWNTDEDELLAYLWQAFLFLPEDLKDYWSDWGLLKVLNQANLDRSTLAKIAKQEGLITRFPDLLQLAQKLQMHWNYRTAGDQVVSLERKQLLKKMINQSGTLPQSWQIWLAEIRNASKSPPWQLLLRNHLKHHFQSTLQTTTKRPSRRYGTTPGIRIVGRAKIGLALDTSGSVPHQVLALFQKEIKKIAGLGHQVEVLEADARIQKQYTFQGVLPKILQGGGGTNYDPAIQYLETKARVDLVIYFTDGLGPCPVHWKKVPLVWIIYSEQIEESYFSKQHLGWPGKKVYLKVGALS